MTDLFNNPANDYVYPALSPCVGSGSDEYLEFTEDGLGVVSGSKILSYIDFGTVKIPVSAYSVETKTICEREVVYIPGLTKGLNLRQQVFIMPNTIGDDSTNPLFMQIDLSINYYSGFSFTFSNIDVSANYSQNLNIADALNIALGNLGIKASATYDPSTLTFTGTLAGYDFNISNVALTLIDASENSSSPFTYAWEFDLEEDTSSNIPYAKYPNGGMQGIVMKSTYPTGTPSNPYDHWLYINHVSDTIQYYSPFEIDNYITNIRSELISSYDPTTTWGPFISDLSINFPDSSCSKPWDYDPSIIDTSPTHTSIDGSILYYNLIQECSILNSEIYYSDITTNVFWPAIIEDSSIFGSSVYDAVSDFTANSILNSFLSDSSISNLAAINSIIKNSWVRSSHIQDSSLACIEVYDSSIINSLIKNSYLINDDITASQLDVCDISLGYVFETYAKDSYFYNSQIIDSSILRSVIDASSFVINSVIESTYSNAYQLWIDSSNYIWVIDDPTLSIDDPSSRVEIQFSTINDSSLNNVVIKDSSIYDTFIIDASLIRCTLYNITTDSSSVTYEDCKVIQYNLVSDCSVAWDEDSSTFYTREIKIVNVGMNGCSTSDMMSAGDYLQWITDNNYWNKFGDMYIWTTAADCPTCGDSKNLLDGFYIYNPHPFCVKIEYMLFI